MTPTAVSVGVYRSWKVQQCLIGLRERGQAELRNQSPQVLWPEFLQVTDHWPKNLRSLVMRLVDCKQSLFWIVERSREKTGANERRGAWGEASPPVSSRLFLLAPVSLRCERTLSTNQKGTVCSL